MPGALIPQRNAYIIQSIWKNIPSPTFLSNKSYSSFIFYFSYHSIRNVSLVIFKVDIEYFFM